MDEKQLQDFARRISKEVDPSKNQELIPAATVVLLRDGADGIETLMLRKNSKIAFAGMWVFPGGRIDVEEVLSDWHEPSVDLRAAPDPGDNVERLVGGIRQALRGDRRIVVLAGLLPPGEVPDVQIKRGELSEQAALRFVRATRLGGLRFG